MENGEQAGLVPLDGLLGHLEPGDEEARTAQASAMRGLAEAKQGIGAVNLGFAASQPNREEPPPVGCGPLLCHDFVMGESVCPELQVTGRPAASCFQPPEAMHRAAIVKPSAAWDGGRGSWTLRSLLDQC